MIRRLLLLAVLAAALPLRAEPPADIAAPVHRIIPGENDAGWRPLLAELRAKPPLRAEFEERRYFPFRKGYIRLTGVIRIDPDRGLSLHYVTPEERLMVIDPRGGFMADDHGRRRELPDEPRARAATAALLHVLRFDLAALAENFDLYGARDAETWRFTFVPREGPLADVLQPITVTGDGGLVRVIEMRKSDSQRVEILIGDTRTGVAFDDAEVSRFFR